MEARHEAEPEVAVVVILGLDGARDDVAALTRVVEQPHPAGPGDARARVVGGALGVVGEVLAAAAVTAAAAKPPTGGQFNSFVEISTDFSISTEFL